MPGSPRGWALEALRSDPPQFGHPAGNLTNVEQRGQWWYEV